MFVWKKIISSAIFRLVVIIMAVVVPLNLLTLILGNTAITEVERQISLETQNALKLYINQVDDALLRINTKLYILAREDVDFTRLNDKPITDQEEYYRQMQSIVRLGITLEDVLDDNTLIGGSFAYFLEKDYFIEKGGTTQQSRAVRDAVMASLSDLQPETHQGGWHYHNVNGEPFLILLSSYRQSAYGAWISLTDLARSVGFYKQSGSVLQAFTSSDGQVYHANRNGISQVDMSVSGQRHNGQSYTVVKTGAKYADLCYVQVLSRNQITSSMPSAIRLLQILSVVAVLIIPIILVAMYYWIGRPVNQLMMAMERIEQGDLEYRVPKTRAGTEFDRINRNFNRVMDEVSDLKINMYEQKLKAEKIRLGFLSQQIQPHFIVNTLNILYSYEPEEYQLSQKMILCLSRYFRYVVNARADYVSLGAEMGHIRNYFEIQQARFLHTFRAVVECDPELEDCLIPPLIIQNFTENAIKHSFIPGEVIDITVKAEQADEEHFHICVSDTGAGIPDEVLRKVEQFRQTGDFRMDLGVGIQNSIDRLNIIYGDDANLEISRQVPRGTRIDILIPVKRKEIGQDECDFS